MADVMVAAEGVTAAFNRESFEARNDAGPAWLRTWRAQQWDAYEATPLPTTQLEEWRYTDPKRLKYDVVGLASHASTASAPPAETEWLASRTASGRVLQVGTRVISVELLGNIGDGERR